MLGMDRAKLLLNFLDRTFITKLLILALLYSLLPLAEIFLIIYLGDWLGGHFFTLALAAFIILKKRGDLINQTNMDYLSRADSKIGALVKRAINYMTG